MTEQALLIAFAAFISSIVSGFGGFGGAFILVIVLVPIVGPKAVVPLIAVFAIFLNFSRLAVYRNYVEWRLGVQFAVASLPGVYIGARILAWIPEFALYGLLGVTLLGSLPLRRYFKRVSFSPGLRTLIVFGFIYGIVSGATAGSGMFAIAGLVSFGLQGPVLLGTEAVIGIVNGLARMWSYWSLQLLNYELLIAGVLMGLATLPGTWIASRLVHALGDKKHTTAIEIILVGGGIWMLFQAMQTFVGTTV